ncbi:MAG: NAD(P)H-binding protein [Candidatus Acidiferrum sp.]|jgi:uncharacterized protein YbjT (DUF2867 family)
MYVIFGATGNIGSVITKTLLAKGEKVRVVARTASKLQPFADQGAIVFPAEVSDSAALSEALRGARAAFLMVPPDLSSPDYRAGQEQKTDAIAKAVQESGLKYAVNLSSIAAQAPSGTGPIAGLHAGEKKLNHIAMLHVLHLRPAYFMENELQSLELIRGMGIFGSALKPDLRIPMIATRDIGAYAADRLLKLDFSGKSTQELLGASDVTRIEVTAALGRAIGKPELGYVQFPYEQVQQVLEHKGVAPKTAQLFIEMYRGFNDGIAVGEEPRSAANTTPTTIEQFAQEVFAPAFRGRAAGA